MCSNKDPQL